MLAVGIVLETGLDKERVESERVAADEWQYLDSFKGVRLAERLLLSEFISVEEAALQRWKRISRIYKHASRYVPYYREVVENLGLFKAGNVSLAKWLQLPLLPKRQLLTNAESLRARRLLPGQEWHGSSKTSGTTGQPVVVQHSNTSLDMFAWLKQRELRWFRFNPYGVHLSIRPGEELALTTDGARWPDGQLLALPGWPYLDAIFKTGRAFGFASTNPVQDQLAVLEKIRPDYLLMEPATLENLALQPVSVTSKNNLKGVQSVSQTLTASMKEAVTATLQAPIHQNYGLNEIGLVASVCPEGGRYHVHEEHCHVEIIADSGSPAAPGERGKIVVSSLTNSVMPLLRYDTEDSAVMADADCPCGRTLFSFVDIEGRYRRLAQLPAGSYQRFKAIQATVNQFARRHSGSVEQYQVCHLRDCSFEVIINCDAKYFPALKDIVETEFRQAWTDPEAPPITTVNGHHFRGLEKRKFQIFYSELMPEN